MGGKVNGSFVSPRMKKRLLVLGLGLTFVFLMFEIVLRVSAKLADGRVESARSTGHFTILCLGNSHTKGAGVPAGTAYSFVLERFLNQERPGFPTRVINGGISNGNTRLLIESLESFYKEGTPDLAVIMAGEPNTWNKYKLNEFLNQDKARFDWEEFFLRSRVIRWLSLLPELYHQKKQAELTKDEAELISYRFLAKFEEGHHIYLTPQETRSANEAMRRLLAMYEGKPLPARGILHSVIGHLLIYTELNEALKHFRMALDARPGFANYIILKSIEVRRNNVEAGPLLDELNRLYQRALGERKAPIPEEELNVYWKSIFPNDNSDRSIALMERVRRNALYQSNLVNLLANRYLMLGKPMDSLRVIRELLEVNPFPTRSIKMFDLVNKISKDEFQPPGVRKAATELRKWYIGNHPQESYRFINLQSDELGRWVTTDLKIIARMIRDKNTIPVLQTYHWLWNQRYAPVINESARTAAHELGIPLIETEPVFRKEIDATGDRPSFYTQMYSAYDTHPSEKGHQVIARIIYDELNRQGLLPQPLRNLDSRKIYRYSWEAE